MGPVEGAEATMEAIDARVRAGIDEVNAPPPAGRPDPADVTDDAAGEQTFKDVRSEFGSVDFLVNSAGLQIAQDSDMLEPGGGIWPSS
jgi:glucose 1-dehydrogenase